MNNNKIMDIVIIAMFTSIVFVLEQLLTVLPNIQLTVFLFILYTKVLGFKKTLIIVIIHTLLDNLYMGTLLPYTAIPMFIAWALIPTLLTIFKRFDSVYFLAGFAFIFGFVYGFIMMVGAIMQFQIKIIPYLISDIPFELLMAVSGALSVLILYKPLYKFLMTEPYFTNLNKKNASPLWVSVF